MKWEGLLCVALLSVLGAGQAAATGSDGQQRDGLYVFAEAGRARIGSSPQDRLGRLDPRTGNRTFSPETGARSSSVPSRSWAVGYRLNPVFAVEAGWRALLEPVQTRGRLRTTDLTTTELQMSGPHVAALFIVPFDPNWEFYGRLNVNYLRLRFQREVAPGQNHGSSERRLRPTAGLGLAWHVTDRVDVRAELNLLPGASGGRLREAGLDSLRAIDTSIGIGYRF